MPLSSTAEISLVVGETYKLSTFDLIKKQFVLHKADKVFKSDKVEMHHIVSCC